MEQSFNEKEKRLVSRAATRSISGAGIKKDQSWSVSIVD
jgi:hypothetical protein